MTHRERIEALITGNRPDRLPVTFWRHFYDSESSAGMLAAAMLRFQNTFHWDLMKINPRASYYMEAWGSRYEYAGGTGDKPRRTHVAVRVDGDWTAIRRLDPTSSLPLAEQIEAVRLIRAGAGPELPIVMTVFNPISVAGDLVENDAFLVDQIRRRPAALERALEEIAQTLADYAVQVVRAGADGIFLATTQWASTDLLTTREYERFGRKYDMMVLEQVEPLARFNVLHVCAGNNMLALLADYPVKIVNWDMNDVTNLNAEAGASLLKGKILMGGTERTRLLQQGSRRELEQEVDKYRAFAARHPFILAPDCSIPVTTPNEQLRIIREAVDREWVSRPEPDLT